MAGTYGSNAIHLRTKPRVQVTKGWVPEAPIGLERHLPVQSGVVIKSGQLVVADVANGQDVWRLATGADATAQKVIHIANEDSDDYDVVSAGRLLALSSAGKYEIATGWYDENEVYVAGTTLLSVSTSNAGNLAPRAAGQASLGVVAQFPDTVNDVNFPNNGQNSEADPATFNGQLLVWQTNFQAIIA